MNIADLQKLTPEQQRRYVEIEKRYTSDAWAWVKNWAQEQMAEAEHRAAYAESWDQNRMNMGGVAVLQLLLSQEPIAYQEFELALDELPEETSHAGDLQL